MNNKRFEVRDSNFLIDAKMLMEFDKCLSLPTGIEKIEKNNINSFFRFIDLDGKENNLPEKPRYLIDRNEKYNERIDEISDIKDNKVPVEEQRNLYLSEEIMLEAEMNPMYEDVKISELDDKDWTVTFAQKYLELEKISTERCIPYVCSTVIKDSFEVLGKLKPLELYEHVTPEEFFKTLKWPSKFVFIYDPYLLQATYTEKNIKNKRKSENALFGYCNTAIANKDFYEIFKIKHSPEITKKIEKAVYDDRVFEMKFKINIEDAGKLIGDRGQNIQRIKKEKDLKEISVKDFVLGNKQTVIIKADQDEKLEDAKIEVKKFAKVSEIKKFSSGGFILEDGFNQISLRLKFYLKWIDSLKEKNKDMKVYIFSRRIGTRDCGTSEMRAYKKALSNEIKRLKNLPEPGLEDSTKLKDLEMIFKYMDNFYLVESRTKLKEKMTRTSQTHNRFCVTDYGRIKIDEGKDNILAFSYISPYVMQFDSPDPSLISMLGPDYKRKGMNQYRGLKAYCDDFEDVFDSSLCKKIKK